MPPTASRTATAQARPTTYEGGKIAISSAEDAVRPATLAMTPRLMSSSPIIGAPLPEPSTSTPLAGGPRRLSNTMNSLFGLESPAGARTPKRRTSTTGQQQQDHSEGSTPSPSSGMVGGSGAATPQGAGKAKSKPPVSLHGLFNRRRSSAASSSRPALPIPSTSQGEPSSEGLGSRSRSGSVGRLANWASRSGFFNNSSRRGSTISVNDSSEPVPTGRRQSDDLQRTTSRQSFTGSAWARRGSEGAGDGPVQVYGSYASGYGASRTSFSAPALVRMNTSSSNSGASGGHGSRRDSSASLDNGEQVANSRSLRSFTPSSPPQSRARSIAERRMSMSMHAEDPLAEDMSLNLASRSPPMLGRSSSDQVSPGSIATSQSSRGAPAAAAALPVIPARPSLSNRMNTLPRLLSGYGFPTAAVTSEEEEQQEDDTEDSEGSDDDDEDSDTAGSGNSGSPHPTTPDDTSSMPADADIDVPSVPGAWVTFGGVTPGLFTPMVSSSRVGTARPIAEINTSYFDLPPTAQGARTPGMPLVTPLLPMSMRQEARGRRPERHDGVASASVSRAPSIEGLAAQVSISAPAQTPMYLRKHRSAVNLMSPPLHDVHDVDAGPSPSAEPLHEVWQTGVLPTPGPSFLRPPPGDGNNKRLAPQEFNLASPPLSKLNRRRSMYELHATPPDYSIEYRREKFGPVQTVYPREEEGKEGLPEYTCAVHFEGYMPRKMEFSSPNVQAKDRAWKMQYVVLHGTSVKIYRYDLRTHPIEGEQDWSTLTKEKIAGPNGALSAVHFHEGEYYPSSQAHRFPTSIDDAKIKAKNKLPVRNENVLVKHYTLQNAESGLAADYLKKKHVIRVRADGQQFLLQAKDDRGVIDMVEALQAATNVALDLDTRPLPKFITLPRRRRRRRPRVDPVTGQPIPAEAGTSAGNAPADDRLDRMLADEQHAYAQQGASAVQ